MTYKNSRKETKISINSKLSSSDKKYLLRLLDNVFLIGILLCLLIQRLSISISYEFVWNFGLVKGINRHTFLMTKAPKSRFINFS